MTLNMYTIDYLKTLHADYVEWDTDPGNSNFFLACFCPFSIIFLSLLGRDMAFSSDEQQIRDILAAELADNIKEDWEEVQ